MYMYTGNELTQHEVEGADRVNPVVHAEPRVVLDQILLRDPAQSLGSQISWFSLEERRHTAS